MAKRKSKLNGDTLKKEGARWIERINAAWSREEHWEKNANMAVKAYTNEAAYFSEGALYDYNILHSNVETIVPAIINSPPVPDVRRRFGDDDETAKVVSQLLERAISIQIDDAKLANELESQAQDGFLAGRGVLRVRFYADVEDNEVEALEEAEDELARNFRPTDQLDDGGADQGDTGYADDGEGQESTGGRNVRVDERKSSSSVSNERVCYEAVSWRDFQHGPAKRWQDVPWVSFRHVCESLTDIADPDYINAQSDGVKPDEAPDGDRTIYEIWVKKTRKVHFVSAEGMFLKTIDDPLNLHGFFPNAAPVQPLTIVGRLMPVNPFSIYKRLADELDVITKRIRILTAAMQIKGGFVGAVGNDLTRLAEADDNDLIAIAGVEAAAQAGGLDKLISWWPAEKFVPILAELFKNRDLTKQAIYEITGISDIVRGASKASETLGAQQIKSQWGSLRIKKMQTLMANSARDIMGLTAEIIASKFSAERLQEMTGIEVTDEVKALLNDKALSAYRVDIETDSTVRADLTQKKADMAEFLQGTGTYFANMQPVVAAGGAAVAEPVIELYAAATRNYDLGKSAEDSLDKLIAVAKQQAEQAANQPPQPSPEQIKAQADAQGQQAKIQMDQAKLQGEGMKAQAEMQMKAQSMQVDQQERTARFQMEQQAQQQTQMLAREELQAKIALMQQEANAKINIEQTKAAADALASQADLALKQADLELKALDMQIKMKDLELKQKQIDAPAPKPGAK